MKLLLTGDIHLGRSSSALGESDQEIGSAAGAWNRIVRLAMERQVAAVVISGDLIDKDNRYFEARTPLDRGIAELCRAGIEVIAVAGNHDCHVLPPLFEAYAREHRGARLLGRGGKWDQCQLEANGERLRLVGWSFREETASEDPTRSFPVDDFEGTQCPVMAVVHGDLDASQSRYAPLSSGRMETLPVDAWLLGHVHKHELLRADRRPWILYPGSPQALDPGERGSHGAWIVEVSGGAIGKPMLEPLSSVRYQSIRVRVLEDQDLSSIRDSIVREVKQQLTADVKEEHLQMAVVDVSLEGESRIWQQIASLEQELMEGPLSHPDLTVLVRAMETAVAAPLILDELVDRKDVVGVLANVIRDLEGPASSTHARELMERAKAEIRLHPMVGKIIDGDVEREEQLDDGWIRQRVIVAARRLLGELLTNAGPALEATAKGDRP